MKLSRGLLLLLSFLCLSTSGWAKAKRCAPGKVLVGFDQQNEIICEPLFQVLKATDTQTFEKEILPWLDEQLAEFRSDSEDDFLPIKAQMDPAQQRLLASAKLKPLPATPQKTKNPFIQKRSNDHYLMNRAIFSKYKRQTWLQAIRVIPYYNQGKQKGFKVIKVKDPLDVLNLQKGEILTHVNSKPLYDKKALVKWLRSVSPKTDKSLVFTLQKGKQKRQLTIDLID